MPNANATTQDALARIRARLAALEAQHAESMLDPSERGGVARSAGAAPSSEHVGPAVDDVRVGSPETAGADREIASLAVGPISPDLIDDGVGADVLPFRCPAPALPPEPLPPAWAAVAGTELACSTGARHAADALYVRAGPNRVAPASPWSDFDICA